MASLLSHVNRFHLVLAVLWQLSTFLSTQMLFPIFANYTPAWRCLGPSNTSLPTDFSRDCTIRLQCTPDALEYEPAMFQSTAMDWDWVCNPERSYLKRLYSQSQFIGVLVGMLVIGSLADVIGRKWISVVSLVGSAAAVAASGLAIDATTLLASRFLLGFFIGAKVAYYTLFMEMVAPELRLPLKVVGNWVGSLHSHCLL